VGIGVGRGPISVDGDNVRLAYKHIFIRLSGNCKAVVGSQPSAVIAGVEAAGHLDGHTPAIDGEDHPMSDNAFGIRDGEIAIELPAKFDASLYFIGRICTPWRRREDCPKNARESDAVCTLQVDERWAQALTGVETCSHLVVLYWMSRSRRDLVLQVPRHYGVGRGTFALRSPARPNPIAMSVVRLLRIEGTKLLVVGLDCLDETPLLDIKPYFASTDAVADAVVGWHAGRK
jgi:tRNA-Thr(GGU) m(6)t(6)A37 methyltransferase TsaA